jgi:hypothetical protein
VATSSAAALSRSLVTVAGYPTGAASACAIASERPLQRLVHDSEHQWAEAHWCSLALSIDGSEPPDRGAQSIKHPAGTHSERCKQ